MKITPIRVIRFNAGIESDEAVFKLGISKSTFTKIEQGYLRPSRELLKKISTLYNCSLDEIFNAIEKTYKGVN